MEGINKAASIPNWFDLEKYDHGANMPLLDWTLNLDFRITLKRDFELAESKEVGNAEFDEIIHRYNLLKNHGFLSRTLIDDLYELNKYELKIEGVKPGFGLVYPLPLWRAVEIHEVIQSENELRHKLELVRYQEIFHYQRTEPLQDKELKLKDWYESCYKKESYDDFFDDFGSFSPHICVDLDAPDETIVQAFRDWLKSKRKAEQTDGEEFPTKVSRVIIDKWKKSAVLPYLDLSIYQHLENVHLTAHEIGNAIFPSTADFDTTEAVRKTTRPNVDKALMQNFVLMRHAFIAEELRKVGKEIV